MTEDPVPKEGTFLLSSASGERVAEQFGKVCAVPVCADFSL